MDLFDFGGVRSSTPPFVRVEYEVDPRGWERPGVRIVEPKYGGRPFAIFYTPKKTKQYEAALRELAGLQMRRKNHILDEAVAVKIIATMRVPKSWPKKKRDAALAGTVYPTTKPDFDNISKMVDAFKGVIWTDDTRVVRALVIKQYGERPSLVIEVYVM